MPFIRISGLPGKVYVPVEEPNRGKKHNCRDCFACQMCADDRCRLCRAEGGCRCPPPDEPLPENG